MISSVFTVRRVLVILLAAALAWGFWGELRVSRVKAQLAQAEAALQTEKRDRAEKLAEGIEQARKDDQATINRQAAALETNHAQIQSLRADVSRLRSATGGLRSELDKIRAAARAAAEKADPSASDAGKTAATAVAVLADLLGRCSERRAELAEYADEARIAGQACERSYDALTMEKPR